jgi:hypothetical protein
MIVRLCIQGDDDRIQYDSEGEELDAFGRRRKNVPVAKVEPKKVGKYAKVTAEVSVTGKKRQRFDPLAYKQSLKHNDTEGPSNNDGDDGDRD